MADLRVVGEERPADAGEDDGRAAWLQRGRDEYRAYRESDRWKNLARAVKLRAKGKCEICQRRDGSETAHLTYERIFNERITDLLWVCRPCHRDLDAERQR